MLLRGDRSSAAAFPLALPRVPRALELQSSIRDDVTSPSTISKRWRQKSGKTLSVSCRRKKNALPGGSAFRRPCCERDNTRGLVDFLELKGIVGIAEPGQILLDARRSRRGRRHHGARRLGHRVRARAVAVDGSLRRSRHTARSGGLDLSLIHIAGTACRPVPRRPRADGCSRRRPARWRRLRAPLPPCRPPRRARVP